MPGVLDDLSCGQGVRNRDDQHAGAGEARLSENHRVIGAAEEDGDPFGTELADDAWILIDRDEREVAPPQRFAYEAADIAVPADDGSKAARSFFDNHSLGESSG